MRKPIALLLCAFGVMAPFATHAVDVGVSVQVSQPGVYGRIDIGRYPQPALILPQPVIITSPGALVVQQPAYLWVPPGHRKNWKRHCAKYNACGTPVYFVRHDWYDSQVRYSPQSGPGHEHRHDEEGRGRGKDGRSGHERGQGRN